MRRILFLLFATGCFSKPSFSTETVQISTQVVQSNPGSSLQVSSLFLNWSGQRIVIILTDGVNSFNFNYTGATAVTLMNALNKADLSTTSLHKRIFQQLISDGFLMGSVTGIPN